MLQFTIIINTCPGDDKLQILSYFLAYVVSITQRTIEFVPNEQERVFNKWVMRNVRSTRQLCHAIVSTIIKHQIYLITQHFIIAIKLNFHCVLCFCSFLFITTMNSKFINCFVLIDFSRIQNDWWKVLLANSKREKKRKMRTTRTYFLFRQKILLTWWTASGYFWVSRQKPPCFLYCAPPFPITFDFLPQSASATGRDGFIW